MPKEKGLIAYAPFEYKGKTYQAGDIFTMPAGVERDPAYDEFRNINRKNGVTQTGMTFVDGDGKRAILPVQEA